MSAKILVVDDSPIDRRLLQGILERQGGYLVETVASGMEALAALPRFQPDLVLSDLLMPEVDGLELVSWMQSQYANIPVILITAHGSEELAVKALEHGAASYVSKSQLAERLPEAVAQVLAMVAGNRSYAQLVSSMTKAEFSFCLENKPESFPRLVELVRQIASSLGIVESVGQVRLGMVLEEAMLSAMYRGNLELNEEEWLASNMQRSEGLRLVEERLSNAKYASRRIHVDMRLTPEEARFIVRDEGVGFDVAGLEKGDRTPELESAGGRSWILMQTFLDEVFYNARGNELTLVKRAKPPAAPLAPANLAASVSPS